MRKCTNELTNEDLLNLLKEYYTLNNKIPSMPKFEKVEGNPKGTLYRTRFGNWTNALKLAGLPVKEKRAFSNAEVNDIIELYKSTNSQSAVMEKYNMTSYEVLYLLKKNDIPLNTNRWTEDMVSQLREHYPTAEWEYLLEMFSPFRKSDIHSKASSLGIQRKVNFFTDDEIEILKKNYKKLPMKQLKLLLPNRTESSIQSKALKMGLINREKWPETEIELLKEIYPTHTKEEIMKYFPNRTEGSVLMMASSQLGLSKNDQYKLRFSEMAKKSLINSLKNLSIELGRTPTTHEITDNKNMPGIVSYHRHFGSYSNACKEAGLEINTSIYGLSKHHTALNGDACLSSKELEITNLLYLNGIPFTKEVLYREIINGYKDTMIRCDWYLSNGIVVEYFGMPEKESYKKRMNYKIDLCLKNNITLIALYPDDMKKNYEGLIEKFSKHGVTLDLSVVKQSPHMV